MNVRWDCVVTDKMFPLSRPVPEAAPIEPNRPVEVRVRLFGVLVGPEVTNPLVLQFASGCALRDVIDELGTRKEIEYAYTILEHGSSADRQLRTFQRTGNIRDVVDQLVAETKEGVL